VSVFNAAGRFGFQNHNQKQWNLGVKKKDFRAQIEPFQPETAIL